MLFQFQRLQFVCLFSFLPSLESCPCRGSPYIFRVSRSSQFSFLTSEHGKDPFRNLFFFFLRKQLESVGSLHLSKSQINRLKVFSFTRHSLVKAWSPRNADSTCGMSSEPLPDLGSSCSLYKNKGEVISQPEAGCSGHLFFLSCPPATTLHLQRVKWRARECSPCHYGCQALCRLSCFPNWLEYAGQAPGCVCYILSGLRDMDTLHIEI